MTQGKRLSEPEATSPQRPKRDRELWVRFVEKLIEQTTRGALKWEMRYSGEYERYVVCHVLDREVWFRERSEPIHQLEVVESSGLRWTVPNVPEQKPRLTRLNHAIVDQLSPGPDARAENFARAFLGEQTK